MATVAKRGVSSGRSAIFVTAAMLVAAAPSASAAALDWQPASDLSAAGQDANSAQVAVDRTDGGATAIWRRSNGSHFIIQAATRPAGQAAFGPAQDLSDVGAHGSGPRVKIAPDGSAVAVWMRQSSGTWVVQTATRPAGQSSFGAVQTLSSAGASASQPVLAVAGDGSATVAWFRQSIVQVASRPAGQATFDAAVPLTDGSRSISGTMDVTATADGTVAVAWMANISGENTIQARVRPAGQGSFDAVQNLSATGGNGYAPALAAAPDGSISAVWVRQQPVGGVNTMLVQASTRPAGQSSFGATQDITGSEGANQPAQLAVGPGGSRTAAWYGNTGGELLVQAATQPAGQSSFGASQALSQPSTSTNPQIAIAPDGATTVIWDNLVAPSTRSIQSATRLAGESSFGEVSTVASGLPSAGSPQLGVGPDGTFTAAWTASDGTNAVVRAARGLAPVAPTPAQPISAPGIDPGSGAGPGSATPAGPSAPAPRPPTVDGGGFTVSSSSVKGGVLRSQVRVTSAGRISQLGTRTVPVRGSRPVKACSGSMSVSGAGTHTVRCRLSAGTRRALRKGRVRMKLVTTFIPSGAKALSSSRTVTLPAARRR